LGLTDDDGDTDGDIDDDGDTLALGETEGEIDADPANTSVYTVVKTATSRLVVHVYVELTAALLVSSFDITLAVLISELSRIIPNPLSAETLAPIDAFD